MSASHRARRSRRWALCGLLLGVWLITCTSLWGAQNEGATVKLITAAGEVFDLGERLAVPPEAFSVGDTLEVAVVADDFRFLRAIEIRLNYDPTGLTFIDWTRSLSLQQALEIGPVVDENRPLVRIGMAFLKNEPIAYEEELVVGQVSFEVKDPERIQLAVVQAELVDADFEADTFTPFADTLQQSRRADPLEEGTYKGRRLRELGDEVWWTDAGPDPFTKVTHLSFSTPDSMRVRIDVLDRTGHVIRPLVDHAFKGRYSTQWTGDDFGGNQVEYGTYTLTIDVEGRTDSQRVRFVPKAEEEEAEHGHDH